MQKMVTEILHIKVFGVDTSLENPNYEYSEKYGWVFASHSHDLDIAFDIYNCRSNIWFENITRSYWE